MTHKNNTTHCLWIPRRVDREYGGFMVALNRDGTIIDTDKGMWQDNCIYILSGRAGSETS